MVKKKIASDMLWSISALVLLNGVLQFIVYPVLNRRLGQDTFGYMLFLLGVIATISPSIGMAAGNIRLVESKSNSVRNGNFLLSIVVHILIFSIFLLAAGWKYVRTVSDLFGCFLLIVLTAFRYYGDSDYREHLNYRGYFLYYCAISLGYASGLLLYPFTESWILCFALGEIPALLLLFANRHLFSRPLAPSGFLPDSKKISFLALSYLLHNAVLNMDRFILQGVISASAVSVYYVASLLGKTAALLVGPLNGILIGYLTRNGAPVITRKFFALIIAAFSLVSVLLYAAILLVTPVFTSLLYPDISSQVLEIANLANLSQILCFSSSLLLTVLLVFASERWQLLIQLVHAALFFTLGLSSASADGLNGFVFTSLAVHALRLAAIIILGFVLLRKPAKDAKRVETE